MESFLKELEKHYDLFKATHGEIIGLYYFPQDIYETWRSLLAQANKNYYRNCGDLKSDIHKVKQVFLDKDESGKCYLTIVGNDNRTILVIREDDSNYEDYRDVVGTKITETEFINALDVFQKHKLESANISSRFIREEALPLDVCKEMSIPLLLSYYRYINDYINPIIPFDEPENTVGPAQKPNPTAARKNPVIDIDARKKELLKRNPKKIFKFVGSKTGSRFDAYIYARDGYVLAVVEPRSGVEYQYNLNLGMIDINDEVLIEEMIKEALEAKEDIVMLDDAIMRKNHTTIDSFSENLDIFLENAKATEKFYYDVKKSKDVYHRK